MGPLQRGYRQIHILLGNSSWNRSCFINQKASSCPCLKKNAFFEITLLFYSPENKSFLLGQSCFYSEGFSLSVHAWPWKTASPVGLLSLFCLFPSSCFSLLYLLFFTILFYISFHKFFFVIIPLTVVLIWVLSNSKNKLLWQSTSKPRSHTVTNRRFHLVSSVFTGLYWFLLEYQSSQEPEESSLLALFQNAFAK